MSESPESKEPIQETFQCECCKKYNITPIIVVLFFIIQLCILLFALVIIFIGVYVNQLSKETDYQNMISSLQSFSIPSDPTKADSYHFINTAEPISPSTNVTSMNSHVVITQGGSYSFSCQTSYSIFINSNEDVVLFLSGFSSISEQTAPIVSVGTGKVIINLHSGYNILYNLAETQYKASLITYGPLEIEGNAILSIPMGFSQRYNKGIYTNGNDLILNGGTVEINTYNEAIDTGNGNIVIDGTNLFVETQKDGIITTNQLSINSGSLYIAPLHKAFNSYLTDSVAIRANKAFFINNGSVAISGSSSQAPPQSSSSQFSIYVIINNPTEYLGICDAFDKLIIGWRVNSKGTTYIISSPDLNQYTDYYFVQLSSSVFTSSDLEIISNRIISSSDYTRVSINGLSNFRINNRITKLADITL